ncbi:hypothetical protein [Marinomonas communis]|uniref:hypothetical protein n=1 Tax=Marinomonas communis TaxID=28254 RepID=UPI001D193F71|nr:hypothetical protein [Marinomonas communis]MCC4275339.1 hypothetical protein [Marinomonas communis]
MKKSYLSYFDVPGDLVQVEVKSIIVAGLSVLGLTGLVYQALDLTTTVINEKYADKPLAQVFDSHGLIFVPSLILCLFVDAPWYQKLFFLTVPFANMWIQIIMPLFEIKNCGSYSEAQREVIEFTQKNSGLVQRYKVLGNASFWRLVLISVYLIIAGQAAGYTVASNQKDFYTDEFERVLIRAYSDNAIMAHLDSNGLAGVLVVTSLDNLKLRKVDFELEVFDKKEMDGNFFGFFNDMYYQIINSLPTST